MDPDNGGSPAPEENEQSRDANKEVSNKAETEETGGGHKHTVDTKEGDHERDTLPEGGLAKGESTVLPGPNQAENNNITNPEGKVDTTTTGGGSASEQLAVGTGKSIVSNEAGTNGTGGGGHKHTVDTKESDLEPDTVLQDGLAKVEGTDDKKGDNERDAGLQDGLPKGQSTGEEAAGEAVGARGQDKDGNSAEVVEGDDDEKMLRDGTSESAVEQRIGREVNDPEQLSPDSNGVESNQTDGRGDAPITEERQVTKSATGAEPHRLSGAGANETDDEALRTKDIRTDQLEAQDKPTPPHPEEQTEREEESPRPAYTPATQPTQQNGIIVAVVVGVLAVLAVLVFPYLPFGTEPARPTLNRTEVLDQELLKMKQSFRNQREELWRRSRIHLQRHVKSAKPSEPVSLILAGGRRAERTLGCLAVRLAEAFSMAYNGSVQQLYGTKLANVEHDQAKFELDTKLKEAFEGDKPAAVIHRLEELPPSSSLIFYRYCDHENAAYKHPLLAFTVLLPLDTVGPEVSLPQVEELVHGHIHHKFLIPDQPDTFDKMDVDKLSGLWSRISHLILPVDMEEHIEKGGCKRN